MRGGGGGIHPPWQNERPDEFEVGWSGAKAYGCRQDTEGPAAGAANRPSADETSRAYASCGEEYHSPGEKNAQTNPKGNRRTVA